MTAYWAQWDSSDLDSWQGKDWADELSDDDDVDYDVEEKEDEEQECCSGCMSCLGLSDRDFM